MSNVGWDCRPPKIRMDEGTIAFLRECAKDGRGIDENPNILRAIVRYIDGLRAENAKLKNQLIGRGGRP